MSQTRISKAPTAASACSRLLDSQAAAREVVTSIRATMAASTGGRPATRPDILVIFASFHHRAHLSKALEVFRSELHPAHLLATTVEGVVHDAREIERSAALSVLALHLPGVIARPFWFDNDDGPPSVWTRGFVRERVSLPPDEGAGNGVMAHRGIIMLSDPHSLSATAACAAIDEAAGPHGARIFGGIASGASHAGLNVLAVDRRISHSGAVGLSIFGDVLLDGFVSQGSRPIGPRFTITKAHDRTVAELSGVRAVDATRLMLEALPEDMLALVGKGLLVGIAHDASKRHLGRGDFFVRLVREVDATAGTFTVNHQVRAGMTLQFHARDRVSADDDLSLCLDAEQLRDPVVAALLFTCNARGTNLFSEPNHDAECISRRLHAPPIAGFHCAGEFGIVGQRTHVHTHSASMLLIRALPSHAHE